MVIQKDKEGRNQGWTRINFWVLLKYLMQE